MTATPRTVRLAAAVASIAVTWALLGTVFMLAEPPLGDALLAQAAPIALVR